MNLIYSLFQTWMLLAAAGRKIRKIQFKLENWLNQVQIDRRDGFLTSRGPQHTKFLWEFNFLHISEIPSSSRHENRYQMLQRLFEEFTYSINLERQENHCGPGSPWRWFWWRPFRCVWRCLYGYWRHRFSSTFEKVMCFSLFLSI